MDCIEYIETLSVYGLWNIMPCGYVSHHKRRKGAVAIHEKMNDIFSNLKEHFSSSLK